MTVLKDEAGTGGIRAGRVHRVTSALQVAMAVPLLILSFVSLDRVRATATADLGFAADLLYAAPLELERPTARTSSSRSAESATLSQARTAWPPSLSLTACRSISGTASRGSRRRRNADVAPTVVSAHVTRVGDGYLDTMGIPLLRGRGFTTDDGAGASMVTIISKPLNDKLFRGCRRHRPAAHLRRWPATRQDAAHAHHRRCHRRLPHVADEHRAGTVAVAAGAASGCPQGFRARERRPWRSARR